MKNDRNWLSKQAHSISIISCCEDIMHVCQIYTLKKSISQECNDRNWLSKLAHSENTALYFEKHGVVPLLWQGHLLKLKKIGK